MKKLNKILLTAMAVPSITTPLVTLTSCSQSWGHAVPFSIGASVGGPYREFWGTERFDFEGNNMVEYLQDQYSVDQRSGNYAYSTPVKFVDNGDEEGTWEKAESGWYTSVDEVFNSTATETIGGESKEVSTPINAALASNIDFITTIGSSINAYLNYALQYQAEQIKVGDETNLDIAWGSQSKITIGDEELKYQLNHGKKDGTEQEQVTNNNFFEYNIARSNLTDDKKANALLRTSNVDFVFDYGKFPLPTYFYSEGDRQDFDFQFISLIDDVDEDLTYYSSKETGTEKIDDEDYTYTLYKYESVPIFITNISLQQTYLDLSKKSDSFLVNDYYSSNDDIVKSAGNQWKKVLPELTNYKEDEAKPHYKTFTLHTGVAGYKIYLGDNTDKRLGEISLSDFIALMSYNVKIYDNHPEKNVASINKLDNLFPAFFLILNRDNIFKQLDNDLGADAPYVINQDTINEINADFLGLLQRTSKEGRKTNLNDLTQDSKDLLAFLGTMFGDNDKAIVDASAFLFPDEKIE